MNRWQTISWIPQNNNQWNSCNICVFIHENIFDWIMGFCWWPGIIWEQEACNHSDNRGRLWHIRSDWNKMMVYRVSVVMNFCWYVSLQVVGPTIWPLLMMMPLTYNSSHRLDLGLCIVFTTLCSAWLLRIVVMIIIIFYKKLMSVDGYSSSVIATVLTFLRSQNNKQYSPVLLACSRMREQGVQFTSRLWPCNSLSWLKAMGTATAQHIWCVHTTSGWCMYVNFSELLCE